MITSKQAILFGLSNQEKKILNLLFHSKVGLTATDLSFKANEPRTTINFHLKKLQIRGWIQKIKLIRNPYPIWKILEKSELKKATEKFITQIGIAPNILATVTPKEGYEQIIAGYEKILEAGKTERVFVIQGSQTPSVALKKLPTEFFKRIHAIQKQKSIILDGITSHKGLSAFSNMTKQELQSHYGRLTVVYLVPDEFLDFDEEIYIFQSSVIIMQLKAEKAIIIQDETTAWAFKLLIEFIKQSAKKIDLNDYIKRIVRTR